MADAGVARDPGRLPWLEPYRAPSRKASNRRPSTTVAIVAVGLAVVVTLLLRDAPIFPAVEQAIPPQASVVLSAPADLQQPAVLAPLATAQPVAEAPAAPVAVAHRGRARAQRRIKAVPTSVAYRAVVKEQTGEPTDPIKLDAATADAALAIAALPPPPDPPRPAVDPSAEVVRGKTVQLGVYRSAVQAEAAWRSAIRDYTYLVTMPKSIEAISIRSKRFYRLQLGTPSKKHAKQLCSNLKSIGRACTVA
jgi:hypothetical protein